MATPSEEAAQGRPERSLAERLVEQARVDGVDLVGPGGLLAHRWKPALNAFAITFEGRLF